MSKLFYLGAIIAFWLTTPSHAESEPFNEFVGKGFGDVMTAARQGNQTAMCELIYRHMQGAADFEDAKQTFEWLQKAASPDKPHSLNLLAWFYHAGIGVSKDKKKASELWRQITQAYKLGAEKGDPEAQFMFGQMYSWGFLDNGMPWDVEKAHHWLSLAASSGHANAQYVLATHYEAGSGKLKEPNFVEAYKWYSAAAAKGHPAAKEALTKLAAEMTPAQIAEAKKAIESPGQNHDTPSNKN